MKRANHRKTPHSHTNLRKTPRLPRRGRRNKARSLCYIGGGRCRNMLPKPDPSTPLTHKPPEPPHSHTNHRKLPACQGGADVTKREAFVTSWVVDVEICSQNLTQAPHSNTNHRKLPNHSQTTGTSPPAKEVPTEQSAKLLFRSGWLLRFIHLF